MQELLEIKVLMLISTQIFQECLDELKETTEYRHTLKGTAKAFDRELHKSLVKEIDALYGDNNTIANDIVTDIMEFAEERVKQLKKK
jgi:hypothetical protein